MSAAPLLLHVFATFATGGPQRRTVDLANALGRAYRHAVVALDGRAEAAAGFASDLEVEVIPVRFEKSRAVGLGNLRRLRDLLARTRPQLLLTYNFGALEAALANRVRPLCPHLHFEDGFGPEEAEGRQLPRRVWLRRIALSGRNRIVVPSRTLEAIATQVWRFAPGRVLYIPNGIDCARYADAGRQRPLGLRTRADELLVGAVGMLRPEKNLARLLRVFAEAARHRPARLVIVGDGPERAALQALGEELGITSKLTFTGFLPRPEAAFRELDIFALSSDTEQMPLSLVEAMAAGLPAVVTAVGDVTLLLPEIQRAYAVAKEDEVTFADRLGTLLTDPTLRTTLGAANRERARSRYAIESMMERYAALFAGLLRGGPVDASAAAPSGAP